MSKTKAKDKSLKKGLMQPGGRSPNPHSSRAFREFVESVVIAVILAFLFRSFEAEAFVIPTGSMAPTLQGRHMDVACPECGYRFRVGASSENDDSEHQALVNAGLCPICRHPMIFDRRDPNQRSFNGDRILVSKFSYDLFEPERWDVIVFKYPGNAKQNYIKRLVGLPGEWLRIRHGDIYTKGGEDEEWRIARKSPRKLEAMLQLVDDTDYWSPSLIAAGWPSRWQQWTPPGAAGKVAWESSFAAEGDRHSQRFAVEGAEGEVAWLRYRHIVPTGDDWGKVRRGATSGEWQDREGALIADFYGYNTGELDYGYTSPAFRMSPATGAHWVGDIALEAQVTVKSNAGVLLLDLVEAGVHYTARIDVETGEAVLMIEPGQFGEGGEGASEVVSKSPTSVRGPGTYELRLANADNELTLWVDGDPIEFAGPTSYEPTGEVRPHWTPEDPLDLAPAGLGVQGAEVEARNLRILRDVYYLALERGGQTNLDYDLSVSEDDIQAIFSDPQQWESTELFKERRFVDFQMREDEFFPLGDNSPQSKDARIWEPPPYVRRELLTGKALFIYWPHHWRRPVPFMPNFERMAFIR